MEPLRDPWVERLQKLGIQWKEVSRASGAGLVAGVSFWFYSLFLFVYLQKFKEIFEALGGTLPTFTRFLFTASDLSRQFWPVSVLVILALWIATTRYMLRGRSIIGRRAVWAFCWLTILMFIAAILVALFIPSITLSHIERWQL